LRSFLTFSISAGRPSAKVSFRVYLKGVSISIEFHEAGSESSTTYLNLGGGVAASAVQSSSLNGLRDGRPQSGSTDPKRGGHDGM
jgi:hypothetical protein